MKNGDQFIVIKDEGTIRIVPIDRIKNLQNQSITHRKMLNLMSQLREEELELEE